MIAGYETYQDHGTTTESVNIPMGIVTGSFGPYLVFADLCEMFSGTSGRPGFRDYIAGGPSIIEPCENFFRKNQEKRIPDFEKQRPLFPHWARNSWR